MAAVQIYASPYTETRAAGEPLTVLFGPMVGGAVMNPPTAEDQGLTAVEVLYIDIVNPAAARETATTSVLQPGQSFTIPRGQTTNVSINAASAGHRFSAYALQAPQAALVPIPRTFPPEGPVTLTETIPAYLYWQYQDDEDLAAFVRAFNNLAQAFVSWFADVGLPVYTHPAISGALLDWVAQGLYGISRPSLSSGRTRDVAALNTFFLNQIALNSLVLIGPNDISATSDDIFRRIITWNFSKVDGHEFSVPWLKRRIMRFLTGVNGEIVDIDQTYRISVTFSVGNHVDITLVASIRTVVGGSILNRFALNTVPLNSLTTTVQHLAQFQNAAILKQAIESGVLLLPFQFTFTVNVQ